jgi:hypothetical protein
MARQQAFPAGTILVFDKAYTDFRWFAELTAAGVFFVTRLKRNADYTVLERRTPPQDRGIVCDQIIRFRGPLTRQKYPDRLRRVVLRTPDGERLELLTNHLTLGASTITRIYKDRWQIGVSSQGHINQSVKVRPRRRDSSLVAGEASRSESETMEPSDNILGRSMRNSPGCNVQ